MEQKIYAGNLPYSDTEEDLYTLFAKYGRVHSVELVKDKMTARSKGFAWVIMDEDNAQEAITALHDTYRDGRSMTVSRAIPREFRPRTRQEGGFPLDEGQSEREMVAFGLWGDRVKLVTLTPEGKYSILDTEQKLRSILYIATSETLELQRAIEELESLVNDSNSKEHAFQNFFERNPDFILNDDYRKAHPHIALTQFNGQTLIPDFVLEPVDQNFLCDLLELKLPSSPVFIRKKNRERFSAAVSEAYAQLLEYRRFFDEQKHRDSIYETYGLRAYMPKMFLVIGRLGNINSYVRRKIEAAEPGLHLRTYDDVLGRMKTQVENKKKGQAGRKGVIKLAPQDIAQRNRKRDW